MKEAESITFLGTGTSQGVPVIGCNCSTCRSSDSRDKRLRTSAVIETQGKRIIIDAGPDFRQQMLRADISSASGILLTHKHKDHIGGLDDVRAFNFVAYPTITPANIYCTHDTAECVRKDFDYAFAASKYRGTPEIVLHEINPSQPFTVDGVAITPVIGHHSIFEVTGYRIGRIGYLTDFKSIDSAEIAKLCGVELLVVNALRFTQHDSHFSVADALDLINKVSPREAYLTHMSHEIGLHAQAEQRLPAGVHFAYDGLRITI